MEKDILIVILFLGLIAALFKLGYIFIAIANIISLLLFLFTILKK